MLYISGLHLDKSEGKLKLKFELDLLKTERWELSLIFMKKEFFTSLDPLFMYVQVYKKGGKSGAKNPAENQ